MFAGKRKYDAGHEGYVRESEYDHVSFFAILLLIALIIVMASSSRKISERQLNGAIDDLHEALEIIDGPMDEGVPVEGYYDTLRDDIVDALAWLEMGS